MPIAKKSMAARQAAVAPANRARKVRPPLAPVPIDTGDDLDGIRLLSKLQVMDRVGVSYVQLWQWMRENRFPRSRALGGKSVWVKSEVEAWMASLPKRPLKGDKEIAT